MSSTQSTTTVFIRHVNTIEGEKWEVTEGDRESTEVLSVHDSVWEAIAEAQFYVADSGFHFGISDDEFGAVLTEAAKQNEQALSRLARG